MSIKLRNEIEALKARVETLEAVAAQLRASLADLQGQKVAVTFGKRSPTSQKRA